MARYYGKIGFAVSVESQPGSGVWINDIVERTYYGDVIRSRAKWDHTADSINDRFTLTDQFRIVADAFAYENIGRMRYITYKGEYWSIASADDTARPRIVIEIGGVWNGETLE